MAGGTGGLGGGGGGKEKRGSLAPKRKKKKRVGFYLDMTPLVDIAFLLLTFFMFTTTMAQPQVMEMSIPPERQEQVDVKQSELLNIRVRHDSQIFYNIGLDAPQALDISELRNLAVNENLRQKNRLITALKISTKVPYGFVVRILDELNLAELDINSQLLIDGLERERKFALVPMTEEDITEIEGL